MLVILVPGRQLIWEPVPDSCSGWCRVQGWVSQRLGWGVHPLTPHPSKTEKQADGGNPHQGVNSLSQNREAWGPLVHSLKQPITHDLATFSPGDPDGLVARGTWVLKPRGNHDHLAFTLGIQGETKMDDVGLRLFL